MYQGVAEWKALCSLSQDKRAFTCTPRAQGDVPASGGGVWHCVLKDSSGRILETGIVDVRTTPSQLTNAFVRFRNCYRFGCRPCPCPRPPAAAAPQLWPVTHAFT